jgi:hypothetical protein
MSESFVDLLLVRLGREEEKRKVLKLLITNLDLSVTDAENAVNNSPSVVRESVPMGEARIIQKDLYPYIDLLPRLDEDSSTPEPGLSEDIKTLSRPVPDRKAKLTPGDYQEPPYAGYELGEDDAEIEPGQEQKQDKKQDKKQDQNGEGEEEGVLVTTAGEEFRSTRRCHICGRTPVDGEKLAPCRTCTDLTCRDCFDRVAHVCSKCAAEGKTVDRVNEGIKQDIDEGLVFDADESSGAREKRGSYGVRTAGIAIVVILAIAAVFYFMDPMGLFAGDGSPDGSDISIGQADTSNTLLTDTTGAIQLSDSSDVSLNPPDTTAVPSNASDDPFGLQFLVLADKFSSIVDPPSISFLRTLPSSIHAEIPGEETEILSIQVETIAAWIPIQIDRAAFMVYNDTTAVLVLAVLHPEENDRRIAMMRETALWLSSSSIDQLVLVYKENRYQDAVVFSLVKEVFPEIEGVLNPSQFQSFITYSEDCPESVLSPVVLWLSNME